MNHNNRTGRDTRPSTAKHLTAGLFVALLLIGTTAPVTSASEGFDVDAWADHCVAESEAVSTEFAQYPDGVPQSVAYAGVQRINTACYATLPVQLPTQTTSSSPVRDVRIGGHIDVGELDLGDADKKLCAGNMATAMGWSDYITVLGSSFPVQGGPASGDLAFYRSGDDDYAVGYVRSTFDDIAFAENGVAWFFAHLPMAGTISWSAKCLLGQAYDFDAELVGLPLIWTIQSEGIRSAMAAPLEVHANGGLCFPLC